MAGELVSFGIQKLYDLLSQEYAQFQGVDDQVPELKRDLNMLSSFLKDADAKKHKSAMVRNCVEDIKYIICDAEDIVETYLLKEKFGKTSGIKKRIKSLACVVPDRREIAIDIGGISRRISKVISVMQSFGIQQIITDGGYMQPLHDRQREMRHTFSEDNESHLVGLEEKVKTVVGYLVEEEDTVQVVSITGMGGVGKTTLARQVFNHEMVKHHFDALAWVCVSQEFTWSSVWQTILRALRPNEEEKKISKMPESTLHDELFQLLETSKALIVLDDIWKDEDWNLIRPIFPTKKGGWKVLLTSRNENVASRGDITCFNFKPECLSAKESWELFQRIAFPKKDASELKVDEKLEEMGKQMIKHCGGLPLAVRVLGGLLATKDTLDDWERVNQNVVSHVVGRSRFSDSNNSSIYHVLSMSFEELPSYLKTCFLYLAHFPEDHSINVEKLSYFWAVEGILRDYDGESIRDVGDEYMEELVRRNMVISERDIKTRRYETCHLHDMMREICLFKAKEENFLVILGNRSPIAKALSPGTSRRFISHSPSTLDIERDISHPKVRSLLVFWNIYQKTYLIPRLSFKRLQLSRLLDLPGVLFEGNKLPSSIGKLIHLRYLNLKHAFIYDIPSSLGNLKLLIYLDLRCVGYIFLPNVLMGMIELRYLALPARMWKIKLELSTLVNLETLINFSTANSSVEDLHGMTKLRILKIRLPSETSLETLSASIGGVRHLEDLEIEYEGSKRMKLDGTELNFMNFKQLKLNIRVPILSDGLHFPSQLTYICLNGCRLEKDPMPILEKLLHLKEVVLLGGAFSGRRMVCSGSGFPKLHSLMIYGLDELEEWVVEEGSMPLLHTLDIRKLDKLKELPDGMRFITSLKELCLYYMGEQWKEKLSEGGEDYYKVEHIPSVTFYM
uniref:Putative disease resistance protein n=2 Tax=Noccaea caerulescens TaxID=107243 RepID=A0A1J3DJY9_NOCCA